jgi:solute carrier family 25 phosphate transporter 3
MAMYGAAAILTLPLAAGAIDHPVDQAILGIPIPVPDIRYFISGGLCAALSHGVTTPIDVVKTRIQSEPEVFNEGLLSATRTIVAQNGVGALLGGLGPTVVGYGSEGAIKFGLYESLKPVFSQFLPADDVAVAYLAASVIAGAAASLLLCPMEHTRIRLVTEPTFAKGLVCFLSSVVYEPFLLLRINDVSP